MFADPHALHSKILVNGAAAAAGTLRNFERYRDITKSQTDACLVRFDAECMATDLESDSEGGRKSPFSMFIRPIPEKLETASIFGCKVFSRRQEEGEKNGRLEKHLTPRRTKRIDVGSEIRPLFEVWNQCERPSAGEKKSSAVRALGLFRGPVPQCQLHRG